MMILDTTQLKIFSKLKATTITAIWRMLMITSVDNWTHCMTCYIRRDHYWDIETQSWRCDTCKSVNAELTIMRKRVTEVAETYLEENPEE